LRDCLEELKPSMVILLDISNVGTESGINWQLMDYFDGLESSLILGGGITREDLSKLSIYGVDNVLVGTALHHGKIEPNF
jgi:phosphoribosylformimino-5-aminoimidazole carboxamide ribotide isomerase